MKRPLTEKRPRLPGWNPTGCPNVGAVCSSAWVRGHGVAVISALTIAEYPDGDGVGPQWHVSITYRGRRPKSTHVRAALRAFGMVGAEEDNHHPGNARHFWTPVDPAHRVACQCKDDEVPVRDADGYRWTNPRAEIECRGCEFEVLLGRPCPLHSEARP